MASENEASCKDDPNFAVICAFFEKFGTLCGLNNIDFLDLQEMLENSQEVAPELIDLHVKLLRKARKSVSAERWERALIKACHTFCSQDAWELERFGYKNARLSSKLRILKQLLDMQFDFNQKFKNEVNKLSATELRSQPIGKDTSGKVYWYQCDESCQIRVYKDDPDEETLTLIAKDREGLVSLISQLTNGESKSSSEPVSNEDSNSVEVEKPILDTGQKTDDISLDSDKASSMEVFKTLEPETSENETNTKSDTDDVSNKIIVDASNVEENSCNAVDLRGAKAEDPPKSDDNGLDLTIKTNVAPLQTEPVNALIEKEEPPKKEFIGIKNLKLSNFKSVGKAVQSASREAISYKRAFEDDEDVDEPPPKRSNRPRLLRNKKPSESEEEDEGEEDEEEEDEDSEEEEEVSEEIEEPLMLVRGEGQGKANQSGNIQKTFESPIVGEEIEEEIIYFYGEGNGKDSETGKEPTEKSDGTKEEKSKELTTTKQTFKLGTIIDSKTDKVSFKSPTKRSRWDVGGPLDSKGADCSKNERELNQNEKSLEINESSARNIESSLKDTESSKSETKSPLPKIEKNLLEIEGKEHKVSNEEHKQSEECPQNKEITLKSKDSPTNIEEKSVQSEGTSIKENEKLVTNKPSENVGKPESIEKRFGNIEESSTNEEVGKTSSEEEKFRENEEIPSENEILALRSKESSENDGSTLEKDFNDEEIESKPKKQETFSGGTQSFLRDQEKVSTKKEEFTRQHYPENEELQETDIKCFQSEETKSSKSSNKPSENEEKSSENEEKTLVNEQELYATKEESLKQATETSSKECLQDQKIDKSLLSDEYFEGEKGDIEISKPSENTKDLLRNEEECSQKKITLEHENTHHQIEEGSKRNDEQKGNNDLIDSPKFSFGSMNIDKLEKPNEESGKPSSFFFGSKTFGFSPPSKSASLSFGAMASPSGSSSVPRASSNFGSFATVSFGSSPLTSTSTKANVDLTQGAGLDLDSNQRQIERKEEKTEIAKSVADDVPVDDKIEGNKTEDVVRSLKSDDSLNFEADDGNTNEEQEIVRTIEDSKEEIVGKTQDKGVDRKSNENELLQTEQEVISRINREMPKAKEDETSRMEEEAKEELKTKEVVVETKENQQCSLQRQDTLIKDNTNLEVLPIIQNEEKNPETPKNKIFEDSIKEQEPTIQLEATVTREVQNIEDNLQAEINPSEEIKQDVDLDIVEETIEEESKESENGTSERRDTFHTDNEEPIKEDIRRYSSNLEDADSGNENLESVKSDAMSLLVDASVSNQDHGRTDSLNDNLGQASCQEDNETDPRDRRIDQCEIKTFEKGQSSSEKNVDCKQIEKAENPCSQETNSQSEGNKVRQIEDSEAHSSNPKDHPSENLRTESEFMEKDLETGQGETNLQKTEDRTEIKKIVGGTKQQIVESQRQASLELDVEVSGSTLKIKQNQAVIMHDSKNEEHEIVDSKSEFEKEIFPGYKLLEEESCKDKDRFHHKSEDVTKEFSTEKFEGLPIETNTEIPNFDDKIVPSNIKVTKEINVSEESKTDVENLRPGTSQESNLNVDIKNFEEIVETLPKSDDVSREEPPKTKNKEMPADDAIEELCNKESAIDEKMQESASNKYKKDEGKNKKQIEIFAQSIEELNVEEDKKEEINLKKKRDNEKSKNKEEKPAETTKTVCNEQSVEKNKQESTEKKEKEREKIKRAVENKEKFEETIEKQRREKIMEDDKKKVGVQEEKKEESTAKTGRGNGNNRNETDNKDISEEKNINISNVENKEDAEIMASDTNEESNAKKNKDDGSSANERIEAVVLEKNKHEISLKKKGDENIREIENTGESMEEDKREESTAKKRKSSEKNKPENETLSQTIEAVHAEESSAKKKKCNDEKESQNEEKSVERKEEIVAGTENVDVKVANSNEHKDKFRKIVGNEESIQKVEGTVKKDNGMGKNENTPEDKEISPGSLGESTMKNEKGGNETENNETNEKVRDGECIELDKKEDTTARGNKSYPKSGEIPLGNEEDTSGRMDEGCEKDGKETENVEESAEKNENVHSKKEEQANEEIITAEVFSTTNNMEESIAIKDEENEKDINATENEEKFTEGTEEMSSEESIKEYKKDKPTTKNRKGRKKNKNAPEDKETPQGIIETISATENEEKSSAKEMEDDGKPEKMEDLAETVKSVIEENEENIATKGRGGRRNRNERGSKDEGESTEIVRRYRKSEIVRSKEKEGSTAKKRKKNDMEKNKDETMCEKIPTETTEKVNVEESVEESTAKKRKKNGNGKNKDKVEIEETSPEKSEKELKEEKEFDDLNEEITVKKRKRKGIGKNKKDFPLEKLLVEDQETETDSSKLSLPAEENMQVEHISKGIRNESEHQNASNRKKSIKPAAPRKTRQEIVNSENKVGAKAVENEPRRSLRSAVSHQNTDRSSTSKEIEQEYNKDYQKSRSLKIIEQIKNLPNIEVKTVERSANTSKRTQILNAESDGDLRGFENLGESFDDKKESQRNMLTRGARTRNTSMLVAKLGSETAINATVVLSRLDDFTLKRAKSETKQQSFNLAGPKQSQENKNPPSLHIISDSDSDYGVADQGDACYSPDPLEEEHIDEITEEKQGSIHDPIEVECQPSEDSFLISSDSNNSTDQKQKEKEPEEKPSAKPVNRAIRGGYWRGRRGGGRGGWRRRENVTSNLENGNPTKKEKVEESKMTVEEPGTRRITRRRAAGLSDPVISSTSKKSARGGKINSDRSETIEVHSQATPETSKRSRLTKTKKSDAEIVDIIERKMGSKESEALERFSIERKLKPVKINGPFLSCVSIDKLKEPEQSIPSPVSIKSSEHEESSDVVIIEDDPLDASFSKKSVTCNTLPLLSNFEIDTFDSPPSIERRNLRKRGRNETEQETEEGNLSKKPKIKTKRQIDHKLRRSIEEQKKKEASTSEDDDDKPPSPKRNKNIPAQHKKISKPRAKRKKTLLGLDIREVVSISESPIDGNVRQSRRIAQLKIREEAERRKIEDIALPDDREKKKKSKKNEDKDYKGEKKKRLPKEEAEPVVAPAEEDDKKKKRKRKRKYKDPRKIFDESNPWRSSSDSSSNEEQIEEEEEEIVEYSDAGSPLFRSDHEFSPESDIEESSEVQPLKRARTARKEDDVEEVVDDHACQKCGKNDHPEWILLCDGCDNGWHCSCLRPALLVIPEGDWYCPPCQHSMLVKNLEEKLVEFDKKMAKRKIEVRRKERLAYVGISLANVLPVKDPERKKREKGEDEEDEIDSESEESSSSESNSSSESDSDEPIYQLRQRRQAHSYRFNDYDDLINSAIQDEMEAVQGAGNQGRGKDISTIVNAEKEDQMEVDTPEEPLPPVVPLDTDLPPLAPVEHGSENEEEKIKPAKKFLGRKKQRKLNSLDVSSGDDDDYDEDFKGSSSDDDEDDFEDPGSDSSEGYGRKRGPVRRSTRARTSRYDKDFINDNDSDDDAPRRRKNRSIWDESESEDSDRSWGRRKKRGRATISSTKKKRSKKSKKRFDDSSDENRTKKKKRRIKYGGLDDDNDEEEEDRGRRTRGKKIDYAAVLASDSDDEVPIKRAPLRIESDDDYVANDDQEEEEEEDPDVDAAKENKETPQDESTPPIITEVQLQQEEQTKADTSYEDIDEEEENAIEAINKNLEEMDEEEMEKMMEEEEYATKQLQLMAMQLEKEKKRKEREAMKKLETDKVEKVPQKRGRKPKALTQIPPIQVLPVQIPLQVPIPQIPIPVENLQDIPEQNLTFFNDSSSESPRKRRGRGKGKKTLEKEAAAAAATSQPPIPGEAKVAPGPESVRHDLHQGAKLAVAAPPQPFSQSQPSPSVITRMLQGPPITADNYQMGYYPERPTSGTSPLPPTAAAPISPAGTATVGQIPVPQPYMHGSRNVPQPYRHQSPQVGPYHRVSPVPPHRARGPQPGVSPLYHHHTMDPSPSGGGTVTPTSVSSEGTTSPVTVRPASASPHATKSDSTPPPPPYARSPQLVQRFTTPAVMAGSPVRHQAPPPPQHMQQPARVGMPYQQVPPNSYGYGGFMAQNLTAGEESMSNPGFQYGEQFSETNSPQEVAKGYEEENSGEFGGLVSYFSSQREDDLDT